MVLVVWPKASVLDCVCVNVDELVAERLYVFEYLEFKEHLVNGR